MIERLRTPAIAFAVIAGVGVITWAAWWAGQQVGEPGAIPADEVIEYEPGVPPAIGGFLGFEGINDRLGLGTWGTVEGITIETITETVLIVPEDEDPDDGETPLPVPTERERDVLMVQINTAGATATLALDTEEFIRLFGSGEILRGDRVTVRTVGDETTVLVTRQAVSSEQ